MTFDLDPEKGIVLPIDKPYRWTSADVIRKVKYAACRHFGKKNLKVGHAGTLDPLATGILLVCIGKATKRAEELQASPKEYVAGISFGATTPSYDLEKEIDRTFPLDAVNEDSVRDALSGFLGAQMQVAPLFSAKSVDGVRAYETARRLYREAIREGMPFNPDDTGLIQANSIEIHSIEMMQYYPAAEGGFRTVNLEHMSFDADSRCRIHVADISSYSLPSADVRVSCSKGTYIRALARDIGESMGTGAFLNSLRRTGNGGFTIEDALTLEQVMDLLS